ncbi:uncharacterized protein MONOS_15835 [Monocercomonoides exilis]|uniref:uncharacterized protein n=1 Tax=Monocercomonoides exilis TaxID=2049356 RepID=UPI003559C884|nr:hypothetical protein MONOS_15835 [Monocercomonoides exilis]|eukprot:MONOS_15835.1-p1 / transcript=MONOS_15835.1 / gene=MONOS_15835 / organism=Monocercomonoides_exilis_PA203 / gene_product=unspecified product / transcript_product=unspecified product / location=Mono_scaffold01372:8890-9312(-) / protein_length=124 / sequence_SO=supercontig / SO=protein_coding / is_pseudo=false
MSLQKTQVLGLAASSEARSLTDPHEKGLYLHLVCGLSKSAIEEGGIITRHSLKRAEKAQNAGRYIGKPGKPTIFTKSDVLRIITRLEFDTSKGIYHTTPEIAKIANEIRAEKRSEENEVKCVD